MTTPDKPLRVEIEVEIAGTPQQVWEAIASAEGISSWFLPTEFEPRQGGAVVTHMGDDDSSPAWITAWDPPRRLVYDEPKWAELAGHPDALVSPLTTEFLVEARSGGTCVVRRDRQRLRHRRRVGGRVHRRDGDLLPAVLRSPAHLRGAVPRPARHPPRGACRHHRRRRRRGHRARRRPQPGRVRPRRAGRRRGGAGAVRHRPAPGPAVPHGRGRGAGPGLCQPVRPVSRRRRRVGRVRRMAVRPRGRGVRRRRPKTAGGTGSRGWADEPGTARPVCLPWERPHDRADDHDHRRRRRGPMPQYAIETQGLVKHFGETKAVDGVDLRVRAGTVYGVLGPNGAGKTTTIRMLATLHRPRPRARRASSATTWWPTPTPCGAA